MIEILGYNLKHFFDVVDPYCNKTDIKYADSKYEVWEVSDDLHKQMCDMSEAEFCEIAGDNAWWRSADGSVMGEPDVNFTVNGEYLLGWDSPNHEKAKYEYENLSEYLCDCIGVSQPRNVCALAVDLAKYNDMAMAELFNKYEGS